MKNNIAQKFENIGIKTQLMAVCLLLVIVPVVVLGIVSYTATKNGINEQSSVLLQQEVLLVKAQVESNYNMIQEKLKSDLGLAHSVYDEQLSFTKSRIKRASTDQSVVNSFSDPDSLHTALIELTKWGNLDFLTVTDTSGKVIARANNRNSGDTFFPDQVHKATNGGFVSTEIIANKYLSNEGLSDRVGQNNDGMTITAFYPVVINGKTVGTMVGGYILNNNHKIVDEVKTLVGGTATIFQDDLRISTNVEKTDGTRAIGTTISDTVYNAVVTEGKTYYGKAWVVNDWYQTAYEPIEDSSGNVIGILYVGVRQSEFQNDMMNGLAAVVIGKTGYIYLLDNEGNYVLSGGRSRDGDNIWEAKDASGRLFVQDIINKGLALKGDETYVEYYPWQNKDESSPRMKMAAIAYSPEFDWVIGASCYDEDFAGPITTVKNITILVGIISIISGALIAYLLSRSISGKITGIVDDFKEMTDNIVNGKLDSRGDPDNTGIDFKEIPNGLNNILDAVISPLNVMAEYIDRISKGNIPDKITEEYKGDFNEMKNNVNLCIDSINAMTGDINEQVDAAINGKLDARIDTSKHSGDFEIVMQGINNTLDAVIGPLNMTAEYVERISKGDIPDKITEDYKGDFNEIKNNVNLCIDAINAMVADINTQVEASINGEMDARIDTSKHGGDFNKVMQGINDTLDAVTNPLEVMGNYIDHISKGDIPDPITDEYKGDFNEFKVNVNLCIDAINAMVADMEMLCTGAKDGNLDVRADISKHGGDFRAIVQGVNDSLEAIVGPVQDCARVLQSVADGDLTKRTEVEARGQLQDLLNNIDTCVDSIADVVINSKDVAKKISMSAQQLSSSAQEMTAGTEQVSSTMSQIAEGATNQSEQVNSTSSTMEEMANVVKDVTDKSRDATEASISASQTAQEGGKAATTAASKMMDIQHAVEDSAQVVQGLGERSKQIGDIVSVITGIAEQTNLLALNAAIEAARAGEAGRGFAVVADEVKNLAEESRGAAEKVAILINETQGETDKAVKSMEAGTSEVEEGASIVNEALVALEDIAAGSQEVANMVEEISASTHQQQMGIENVVKSIDGIAAVAQQSAAGTQEASGAAQEQTASMEEVTSQIQELANISNDLMNSLSAFAVSEATGKEEIVEE
ncbi:MAG: Cache 3/Cache 2 fusion domain-containing protein [Methanosarcinales archaeon]|nr:Cache 3/Cache 2 fusion domain-containing protein [Methanosarcinales archaeon]